MLIGSATVSMFFRRRRPPHRGWCGLSFFFVEPHGLPLFFADPLDITISACVNDRAGVAQRRGFWYTTRHKAMTNRSVLVFVVFMIHALAEAWHMPPEKVYAILSKSEVLDKYIIRHYDVLHTLGKEYLVDDITGCVQDWGYKIK